MDFNTLILLLIFQLKHLIADYFWQFPYMYENKGKPEDWAKPLTDHAGMHAAFTLIIAGLFTLDPILTLGAGLFDFITHFITDRWKATQGVGPDTSKFWTDLGIDQMVHHSVSIIIIYFITNGF